MFNRDGGKSSEKSLRDSRGKANRDIERQRHEIAQSIDRITDSYWRGSLFSNQRRSDESDDRRISDYFRTKFSSIPGGSEVINNKELLREFNNEFGQNEESAIESNRESTFRREFGRSRGERKSRGAYRGMARGIPRRPQGLEFQRREIKYVKPSPGHYGVIPGLVRLPSEYTERSRQTESRSRVDFRKSDSLKLYPDLSPSQSSNEPCSSRCDDPNKDVAEDITGKFSSEIIKLRKSRLRTDSLRNTFELDSGATSRSSRQTTSSVLPYDHSPGQSDNVQEFNLRSPYRRTYDAEHHRYRNSSNKFSNHSDSDDPNVQRFNGNENQERNLPNRQNVLSRDFENELRSPYRRTYDADTHRYRNPLNTITNQIRRNTKSDISNNIKEQEKNPSNGK